MPLLSRRAFCKKLLKSSLLFSLTPMMVGCLEVMRGSSPSLRAQEQEKGAASARAASEPPLLSSAPLLHVATTRRLLEAGQRSPFLDSSRSDLIYVQAALSPPLQGWKDRVDPRTKRDYSVKKVEKIAGESAAQALAENVLGQDTLLFVHGYNQSFEAASQDITQLGRGIDFRGHWALFSWASKDGFFDYGYDRESVLLARDPLVEVLTALLQNNFGGGGRLHLVAHSMGTLLTLEALRMYRDRFGEKGMEQVGALVLAAPDIDEDVFRSILRRLGGWKNKITVITATNDRALNLSSRLSGGNRVGALSAETLRDMGLKVIDATEFTSGIIGHDAFVADAEVRAAIRRTIERP